MVQNIKIKGNSEGEFLGVAGGNYRIIISGKESNGKYAVIEMTVPPNGGPSPHSHPNIEETFYILQGELEFKTETGRKIVSEGGYITIPMGGAIHCFKNTENKVAKLLCTVMPAGLEETFREMGTPVEAGQFLPVPEFSTEQISHLQAINEKYGMKAYPADFLDKI